MLQKQAPGRGIRSTHVEPKRHAALASDSDTCRPVYGLIFLFKWQQGTQPQQKQVVEDANIYFAKQVIENACATQALLSILMNKDDIIEVGPELVALKVRTMHSQAASAAGTSTSACAHSRPAPHSSRVANNTN